MSVDMVDVKYTDYGHNDTWWWIYYGVGWGSHMMRGSLTSSN